MRTRNRANALRHVYLSEPNTPDSFPTRRTALPLYPRPNGWSANMDINRRIQDKGERVK